MVYERNDVAIRELEGMAQGKGWYPLPGEAPPAQTTVDIMENGIIYTVDFENGQKTGFFLDQKYNRLAVAKLARDRTVLDCFTHTGSFALNAAKGGAKHPGGVAVVAIDENDNVLTVKQYRYAFQTVLEEIPAGKLERGEDPAAAARRELSEETGASCETFTPLGEILASPGGFTE